MLFGLFSVHLQRNQIIVRKGMEQPKLIKNNSARNSINVCELYWNVLPPDGHISAKESNEIPSDYHDDGRRWHCHNFYVLCLPLSETLEYSTFKERFHVQPGTLVIEHPLRAHKYNNGSYPKDTLIVNFTEEALAQVCTFYTPVLKYNLLFRYDTIPMHNERIRKEFIEAFHRLKKMGEQGGNRVILSMKQSACLLDLLSLLMEQTVENNPQDNPLIPKEGNETFIDFLKLVEKCCCEEDGHAQSFYAERLNISDKKLANIIQINSGKTAKDIINDQLMSLSKIWLSSTDKQIKNIAYDLGFNNSSNYTDWFKSLVGKTPTEYRLLYKLP